MAQPIPIVADVPMFDPRLGFERYAAALADAIRGGQPPQFTVGLYGPWGSGKSSLLNAIARNLEGDPGIVLVTFDAWRYERSEHIVVPLLHRVDRAIQAIDDEGLTAVKARVRSALLSVIRSVTFSVGPLSVDPSRAVAAPRAEPIDLVNDAFTRPYEDMRAISESLNGRRIVALIDDLDRCSSDKVVAVLEAINLVMDVPGFIFVLALDYDVLVKAVVERYPHTSGHIFIEKMVQVPIRVPRLEVDEPQFLTYLVPEWESRADQLPAGFSRSVYDVSSAGLDFNPRQIKRLINSMLVLLRVGAAGSVEIDQRLLAGVVGLQLRWPDEYRDLADAVFSDDADPTADLHASQDDDLRRYTVAFFAKGLSSDTLRPILTLTRAVDSPARSDVEGDSSAGLPAVQLREINLARLLQELANRGFVQSRRLETVYAKPDLLNIRVKLGKTVVRFEGRGQDLRWHLGDSFLLTNQIEDALAVLASDESLTAQANLATRAYGGVATP